MKRSAGQVSQRMTRMNTNGEIAVSREQLAVRNEVWGMGNKVTRGFWMPRKRLPCKDPVPRHGVFPPTGNKQSHPQGVMQQSQHVVAQANAAVCDKGAKVLTFAACAQVNSSCISLINILGNEGEGVRLKQIGMGAGAEKRNNLITGYVGNNPVPLYMTFRKAFQIAVEPMFMAVFRQGFIPDKRNYNIIYFIQIFAALMHKLEVFFELIGKVKVKHRVIVGGRLTVSLLIQKVLPNFFKFFRFMPFYRDFPSHNSLGLFKSRQSFGIIARVPGYRVNMRRADRARMRMDVFAVNPVAGIRRRSLRGGFAMRSVWGLGDTHEESVA